MELALDENYWSNRYSNNTAAWDAGSITPPLKAYIDQLTDKQISILIPGCGNGHEAAYLLDKGFKNITLIDISSILCEHLKTQLQAHLSSGLQIICGDFFDHTGEYDLVMEQTFFCAIDPTFRKKYVYKMLDLLKPGGKLAGLLFNCEFVDGPPFGGTEDEYRQLFQPLFTIATIAHCYNSITPRAGKELFIKMMK